MSDTRQLLEQLQHCTVRRERYRNFLQTLIERGAADKVIEKMREVVADEEQECRRIEAALLHRIQKNGPAPVSDAFQSQRNWAGPRRGR